MSGCTPAWRTTLPLYNEPSPSTAGAVRPRGPGAQLQRDPAPPRDLADVVRAGGRRGGADRASGAARAASRCTTSAACRRPSARPRRCGSRPSEARQPFDLASAPLFRADVVRMATGRPPALSRAPSHHLRRGLDLPRGGAGAGGALRGLCARREAAAGPARAAIRRLRRLARAARRASDEIARAAGLLARRARGRAAGAAAARRPAAAARAHLRRLDGDVRPLGRAHRRA